jgi:alpha-mannosidase
MKYNVHLICNAHLDPVWQWRWTEGCSEALMTFRNAVEILDEYPELIFNHSEAILYQWVQQYDPALFIRIQELVSAGRWFISGGWLLQPDVNLPPVENLYRNIRMGRDYFKKYFGSEPRVAYNFDSFGHPGTLPDILSEFGYNMYIHQRPEKEFLNLPSSLYNWKGPKGNTIGAYRIEIGLYHTERTNIEQRLREGADMAVKLGRDVAVFWGIGDHGGGASRADLDKIRKYILADDRVEFIHSTTDRFFESVSPLLRTAPVFEGGLQRIFTGCYTSLSRIKRKALEASGAAVQAERLRDQETEGLRDERRETRNQRQLTTDNRQPTTLNNHNTHNNHNLQSDIRLSDIWRDILFNDFHDILPGTCTEPAERDALDLYGRAMENIRRLDLDSITKINRSTPPLKAYIPVTLFNSNPLLTTFPVEFECMSDYRPLWEGDWVLKLFDRAGQEITCQEEQPEALLPFHRWRRKISFMADNLQQGVHHFELRKEERMKTEDEMIKNKRSLFLSLSSSFLVIEDRSDSWGTNTWSWRDIAGRFEPVPGSEKVIEEGPVRSISEQILTWNQSKIIIHSITYTGWPVTEYRIRIHWNEERMRLKLAIPVEMQHPRLVAGIPGGSAVFPPDAQEHVHGTWMHITHHASRVTGFYIAHTGLHGFDFDGKEIRLSVLRSSAYCHEQGFSLEEGPCRKFMDIGIHDIGLAVWNDPSIDPAAVSEWLITPPLVWPHLPIG